MEFETEIIDDLYLSTHEDNQSEEDYETSTQNNNEEEEIDYEISHDIKEDEGFEYLESIQEDHHESDEERDHDDNHMNDNDSEDDEEDIPFEPISKKDFWLCMHAFLQYLIAKEKKSNENIFYYRKNILHPSSKWQNEMMHLQIIFESFMMDTFHIELALFLFESVVDENTEKFDEVRKLMVSEVIDHKKNIRSFQKKYEDVDKESIYSTNLFMELSFETILDLFKDTEIFSHKDFQSYYIFHDQYVEIQVNNDEPPHQIHIDSCKNYSIQDILEIVNSKIEENDEIST